MGSVRKRTLQPEDAQRFVLQRLRIAGVVLGQADNDVDELSLAASMLSGVAVMVGSISAQASSTPWLRPSDHRH